MNCNEIESNNNILMNNSTDNNIKVMVRVRPLLEKEIQSGTKSCLTLNPSNKSLIII